MSLPTNSIRSTHTRVPVVCHTWLVPPVLKVDLMFVVVVVVVVVVVDTWTGTRQADQCFPVLMENLNFATLSLRLVITLTLPLME